LVRHAILLFAHDTFRLYQNMEKESFNKQLFGTLIHYYWLKKQLSL